MMLSYGLGVYIPEHRSNTSILGDVWNLVLYFNWLKYPIIVLIWIEAIITTIHLFPKPNHLITRLFEITNVLILALCCILAIMPITLIVSFAYMGWIGFGITWIFGVFYVIKINLVTIQKLKKKMYGNDNVKEIKWINSIWNILKKEFKFIIIINIINMWTLKIGIVANYNFYSFTWLFAFIEVIYFLFLRFVTNIMLKYVIHTFYFTKYFKRYRVLWKVSDKQWFGK